MAAAQYYEQVQQAYLAYYGRPADPAGQAYWAGQLSNANGNMSAIINAFGTSAESTALYGSSSPVAQVNAIYHTLFGRDADVSGLNFYVNGLNNGTYTLASIAMNVYNGATGADATGLLAKQAYADAFTLAVSGTTQAQVAYAGTAAANNARAAVALVVDTPSEVTQQAAIATTVANIGTGTVAQTFTLTTGVDSITATGNSVINGAFGSVTATSNTFGTLDAIKATGTNNTLNLVDLGGGTALPAATTVSGVQTVNLTSVGFGAGVGGDNFTGFTGLSTLNVTEVGGTVATPAGTTGITAAGTTAVNLTDAAQGTGSINIFGGSNVAVTANGATTGAVTVGSTTAAPTGTITVAVTDANTTAASVAAGAITTTGGTTVSVTENIAAATSTTALGGGVANTATGGQVTINGTATTTSATVAQSAAVAAVAGVTAAPAVLPVTAVAQVDTVTIGGTVAIGDTYTATVNGTAYTFTALAATTTSVATGLAAAIVAAGVGAVAVGSTVVLTAGTAGTAFVATVSKTSAAGTIADVHTTANVATVAAAPAVAAVAAVGGIADGAVVINDVNFSSTTKAGTITTVSLSNYNAGATINDSAVSNLTLAGSGGAVTVNSNLTTPAVTTLNLTANAVTAATPGASSLTDAGITTLNVATGGAAASTLQFNDVALTTLNVSGTQNIALTSNANSLTAINVTGGAGVTMNLGAGTTFTSTSTGTDVVTIGATATKAIAGNGTANEEIVWNSASAPAANTGLGTVTGFHVLGIGSATTAGESFDLSKITGFTGIDVQGNTSIAGGTQTVSNVTAGTALKIDAAYNGTFVYSTADVNGATDSLALTLGTATTKAGFAVAGLTLQDNSFNGIGNLTVTSNASTAGAFHTISTLNDASLTNLTVTGTGGLAIGTAFADNATSLTINGTSTGTGGITFAGGINDAKLATLTLTGTDAINLGAVTGNTHGITVNGSADNANITLSLSGLTTGTTSVYTDSITLGNGTNVVSDVGSLTATAANSAVNITTGTGSNTITLGAYATNNVTFGAHGAGVADTVNVAASTGAVVPTAIITGFNDNGADSIHFVDAAAAGPLVALSATQLTAFATATGVNNGSLANVVANVLSATAGAGNLGTGAVAEFQYQGNTYVIEHAGATHAFASGDTLVQLTGAHTLTAASTAAAGVLSFHG